MFNLLSGPKKRYSNLKMLALIPQIMYKWLDKQEEGMPSLQDLIMNYTQLLIFYNSKA